MSESRRKSSSFKKRAHRPWKTDLLENTVHEATLADDDIFGFDIDINLDTNIDSDSFYPEFNFIEMESSSDDSTEFAARVNQDDQKSELRQAIQQTKQQQQQLVQQISDKSTNSVLLGGFFKPQEIHVNNESQSSRKINSLLSDLKVREQKINSLTSNLKISEAYERAEQAELSKRAVAQQLQVAENRMRHSVEQAKQAEEQFLNAMEQAKQAAIAHQEEARLRRDAETQAKEARVRASNAEIELQNERLARIAAEEKAQNAFIMAEKASLFQRQLTDTSEQLVKMETAKKTEETRKDDLQKRFDTLQEQFRKLEDEHHSCPDTIRRLEANVQKLNEEYKSHDQLVAEFNNQINKLKSIIAAEQDLRKNADQKYQQALGRAQKAEQGWQIEVQQRKLIEERAKRAVANATKTVLNLLNTPGDADLSAEITAQATQIAKDKMKVRVTPISTPNEEYDYEEDDLLF